MAASEFYKSKHNVILSAGIFFVSAGRSCLGGSSSLGGARGGLWVIPGCQNREILRFESCNSPVGKSPQEGKAVRGLWPWSLCQGGSGAPLLCLEQDLCGGTAQEGLQSAAIPLGAPGPGTGMGALPPTLHRQWAPCQQQQDQAEGLPPSCMEITLWRGCSCWITHFSVLFPNASPDYRVTMSLSQGTALFCVFLLPTKRQMTLPPWLAGAADADEKTAERT